MTRIVSLKIIITNNLRLSNIPPEIRAKLMDTLTFPNPKWLENERMGRWNRGTPKLLRFYDKTRGGGLWIPRGYMRQLLLLCRRRGVTVEIDDQRRALTPVDFNFIGQLKPFQNKAVMVMRSRDFGTLSAPTGSGKTVMALYMIAYRRQPALIVVHTKDLAYQWVERAGEFLGIPKENVGFIGSGNKVVGEKITVALVQSLVKCAEDVSQHVGFLLVDECHRCPSRTFTQAVTDFDSKYMLGLSATPWRRDRLSKLIFWHLGDVHHKIDRTRLVESGDVLPAEIIIRETNFKPYYDPVNEYSKMISELTLDDNRNRLIASDVAQEVHNTDGVCLILSDRKKHCENLKAILQYRYKLSCEVLTGDLTGNQRREILDRLNQGEVDVLLATGQLIGEGFDRRDLSPLFLTTPIKFSGRVLQYIGRVLRPAPGKKKARVYDYVDVKVDVLKAAARARQKVYSRPDV
ncbi:MAG: DEAD/DEAH box helicase [Deltaproteobacteria bacterium]|nr:DEAD/DEAH box helicase [Deltaproteobacteria bacterium]MBW2089255.1 DEAD/DEAH box helicase [Deltaproteobacteria bacterium]